MYAVWTKHLSRWWNGEKKSMFHRSIFVDIGCDHFAFKHLKHGKAIEPTVINDGVTIQIIDMLNASMRNHESIIGGDQNLKGNFKTQPSNQHLQGWSKKKTIAIGWKTLAWKNPSNLWSVVPNMENTPEKLPKNSWKSINGCKIWYIPSYFGHSRDVMLLRPISSANCKKYSKVLNEYINPWQPEPAHWRHNTWPRSHHKSRDKMPQGQLHLQWYFQPGRISTKNKCDRR